MTLLLPVLAVLAMPQDTLPVYATPETRTLVERAMERHGYQDTLVQDYQARFRYRLSFALGRRRWGRVPTLSVEEQEGSVEWRRPNDLRVEVLGRRARARSQDMLLSSSFDRPWFVPRGLSDSVRIFGNDFPERAALHPLASDGPEWYSYSLDDSIRVTSPGIGTIKLYLVRVVPRRNGPSLIAGSMLLDSATAEVVRLTFRYVGTQLWISSDDEEDDPGSARRMNNLVNRILSVNADLEYALIDGKYWMPYRQLIAGRVQAPLVSDIVVPFDILTTFSDYTVNTGQPIVWRIPIDSLADTARATRRSRQYADSTSSEDHAARWEGGRYEIHRAPRDSLTAYHEWEDSLTLQLSPEDDARVRTMVSDLARLSETLPDELTGRRRFGINYERAADILRYNRVQGLSLGLGYQVLVPGISFTTLQGTARFGLSDSRLTARLALVRDAPGGRLTLAGYREITPVEPFTRNFALGNSMNALFVAHDNADYYLAEGAGLSLERSVGLGVDLTLGARWEHQTSVAAEAESEVNDLLGGSGKFPLNPSVSGGYFGTGVARLDGTTGAWRWSLTGDATTGEGSTVGRGYGDLRRAFGGASGLTVTLRGGLASGDELPQVLFRAGGLRSVRGFDYGTRRGRAFWSAQADLALSRGLGMRPVLFLDAGNAADPDVVFSEKPLIGAGVGVSFLRGLVRADLSHPLIATKSGLRFDLVFVAAR